MPGANHGLAVDFEDVGGFFVRDQVLIEGHGVSQLFLSRGGKASRDRAKDRKIIKAATGQEFPGGIFLQPFLGHHALDQLVRGILRAKPHYRHQLTIAWHTFVAPIEGPDVCEMFL